MLTMQRMCVGEGEGEGNDDGQSQWGRRGQNNADACLFAVESMLTASTVR